MGYINLIGYFLQVDFAEKAACTSEFGMQAVFSIYRLRR